MKTSYYSKSIARLYMRMFSSSLPLNHSLLPASLWPSTHHQNRSKIMAEAALNMNNGSNGSSSATSVVPLWLETLLGERFFFSACDAHAEAKKNERNIYCLDCCSAFCPHCLPSHRPHRLLQVRRYVYHDVVRVEDLERLIDCSFVQCYTANSAKVVFLNERAPGRPFRGAAGRSCSACDRPLHHPHLFCSLSCKVKQLARSEGGVAAHLRECEFLPLPSPCELDDAGGQLSPDSVLDSPSGSTNSAGGGGTPTCTAASEPLFRKKRSSVGSARRGAGRHCGADGPSRRKRAPNRAPLF